MIVALVSLVAGTALLRLEQPYRVARLRDAVQRITLLDQQVRSHARRFGRAAEIVFDLDKSCMVVQDMPDRGLPRTQLALPTGIRLKRLRTGSEHTEAGEARITVGVDGQSPSYAIWLEGPKRSAEGVFFAGLTGQVTPLKAESDEQPLFALLGPARADAP